MFSNNPFYFASVRKIVVSFGKLFTDLSIERKNSSGEVVQEIKIPVAPGSREKWLALLAEDPNKSGKTMITLPRIGFEMVGFQYDPSRKLPRLTQFHGNSEGLGEISVGYTPVPYNIDFMLYIVAKTQGDALQIVEQILPFFTPEYTVTIDMFPEVGIKQDVPFVLTGVSMNDDYDGPMELRRTVQYTLSFVAKAQLLGPIKDGSIILHTRTKVTTRDDGKFEELHSSDVVDTPLETPPYDITESWKDLTE